MKNDSLLKNVVSIQIQKVAIFDQLTALKNKIFAIKFNPLNLESQNQAKNIPWFSQVPQSKFETNRSRDS